MVDALRVRVEEYPGWVDPKEALLPLSGEPHPVLLLSGLDGHPASRFSVLGADPLRVLEVRGRRGTIRAPGSGPRAVEEVTGDPFDLIRAFAPGERVERLPGLPFAGGAIGWLGYGLRRAIERLPPPPDPVDPPDAWLGLYDAAAVFDHRERRIALVAVEGEGAGSGPRAGRRLAALRAALGRPVPSRGGRPGDRAGDAAAAAPRRRATLVTGPQDYFRQIERALAWIAAGDVYQVNLSHRIACPYDGDPLDLFRDLSRRNPAPFAAYIDAGPIRVVSASPERFVSLAGRRARSSPIKGTRPRGSGPDDDLLLARELARSPKDRAENIMIADLVRNDLGRVSVPGSVRATTLCALESFATVHHLVSTIEGDLLPGRDRIDLLRALFPAGSMTGAPKVRAMEVIDELEGEERGIYSGAIGYLSLSGDIDFNIVIRTIICSGGLAHLRVGGAVVADSRPEREFQETLDKARALVGALGATISR